MATEVQLLDLSFPAGEDLSSYQYYAVGLNSSKQAILSDGGVDVLFTVGILQNKPQSGEAASVRVLGISKAVCAASITAGALVKSDGSTGAITTQSSGSALGRILETGSAGRTCSVLLREEHT